MNPANKSSTDASGSGANAINDCDPKATDESNQPQHVKTKKTGGTFASALWASSHTQIVESSGPFANNVNESLETSDYNKAPISLTVTSDPKPGEHKDPILESFISSQVKKELAIHQSGNTETEYTPGQQAVLNDTMRMLARYSEAPSAGELKAMNFEKQVKIVKQFLGTKSAAVYTRSMNSASRVQDSANSAGGLNSAGNVDSAATLPPVTPIHAPVPRTRMRDTWRQRIARQAHPVVTDDQGNELSPEGRYRVFLESRTWNPGADSQPSATVEPFIDPTAAVGGNGTNVTLGQLRASEDEFLQLANNNYRSASATDSRDSDSDDDDSTNSLQYVSAGEGTAGGSNRPDWPENPEDISLARENSDLKNLVQQLEQAAGREEYVNIMNHVSVPEDPRGMPTYHARRAAYNETFTRDPNSPPMFPIPEGNQEPPVMPLSTAHVFQDMMQLIISNEALIGSFEKEFKAFIAGYSPASCDQHFGVANKLITHMEAMKKENEEMGKLIGCGMKGGMLATVHNIEKEKLRQEVLELQEQIDRGRKDAMAEIIKNTPEELFKLNEENQKLREEISRLKVKEQEEHWDMDAEQASLRDEIDSLRLRNNDLQEQLGDMWGNIAKGKL